MIPVCTAELSDVEVIGYVSDLSGSPASGEVLTSAHSVLLVTGSMQRGASLGYSICVGCFWQAWV